MFRFRIFCLVPLLFVGVCQLAGQDSTRVQYRFPSGEVSSEGWLVSGVPEGFWRSYHEDGIRKSEGNRSGGQLEGEWIFYDAKGRVQTTLRYEQGAKQGEEIRWDTTGVQRRIRPWKADVLDGEERVLDDRGILVGTIPWTAGVKEGVALEFARDDAEGLGRIIKRSGYRDDLLRWVEEVNRFDDQGRKTGKWMTFGPMAVSGRKVHGNGD